MRIVVTGQAGQIVTALREAGRMMHDAEIVCLGRPQLDLTAVADIPALIAGARPDVVVNAAAYTAVDQAEKEPDLAMAANGAGAGAVAQSAYRLGVPIIHLSTDYVFDGTKPTAYVETDPVAPLGVYGHSKLAGEQAVAAGNPDHVILRTAWVYAAHGKNFVRTMLRVAAANDHVAVVADQQGCPSYASDLAAAIVHVARNLAGRPHEAALRGIFHLAGGGETSWAGFAEDIFAQLQQRGGPYATVKRIAAADYPTPARRPANSRLDCGKLRRIHDFAMPHWRDGLARCMDRLVVGGKVLQ